MTKAHRTSAQKARTRSAQLFTSGVLCLISLCVTFFALEVAFRIAGVSVGTVYINRKTIETSSRPKLLFQLKPHAVATAEVDYHTNAHRMRNRPVNLEKPSDTKRIAVIGDSIAFGYWVSAEEAFPHQLEQLLNQAALPEGRFEVLNFGVPGYNLDQELAWMEQQALRFDPDLIILALCLNDLQGLFSYDYGLVVRRRSLKEAGGLLRGLIDFGLDHFLVCAWLEYRLTELEVRKKYAGQKPSRDSVVPAAEMKQKTVETFAMQFRRLSKLLEPAGNTPALVVTFPVFSSEFESYPHHWFHQAIREAAARQGLAAVDLFEAYRSYPVTDVRVDPVHPGPMGHRIAAHAILKAIAAESHLGITESDLAFLSDISGYRTEDFTVRRGY